MKNILEIKNLSKKFWKKEVLKNVSFSVWEWEIYWFLWPNWAGKTTTMKNILWFLKPSSGEIKIFWKNIFDEKSKNLWLKMKLFYQKYLEKNLKN